MTGTTPATAASKPSSTPCSRASPQSSSPCWERSCLLAVITCRPEPQRPAHVVVGRVDPTDQLDDQLATVRGSRRSRRDCASTRPRAPAGARSDARSASIRAPSRCFEGGADRPVPEQADRKRGRLPDGRGAAVSVRVLEVTNVQILERLATDDDAGAAVPAEDRPAAGERRCSCWPSRARTPRSPA